MIEKIILIYVEKYLEIQMTFVYRQININYDNYQFKVLTSSEPKNLNIFPINNLFIKKKNIIEYFLIKFYEKILRDRIYYSTHKILSWSQRKYFSKIIDDKKIKFVHVHFGTAALELYPLLKSLNKKILISFHGYDASQLLNSKSYINQFKCIFNKSYVITSSKYMQEKLRSVFGYPIKFYVIYYGIPIDFFKQVERIQPIQKNKLNESIIILQISGFSEKKGHKYTIQAFSKISKKYDNLILVLGGDGKLRKEIEDLVKSYNLENKVKFLGKVSQEQVKNLMGEADIFVHHSITAKNGDQEGIPNVIMEAMASSLPVISTFHTGIPELINDCQNGFLVKEKDVESYVEKIEYILNNDVSEICKNGRKTIIENFNLDKQLVKIGKIYDEIYNQ